MRFGARGTKYKNVRTRVGDISFASKAEAQRYMLLMLLERQGLIAQLELQPKFPMKINGVKVCTYIADFKYIRDGIVVIEDVKGVETDVFRIKAKLFAALYPDLTLTLVKKKGGTPLRS